MSKTGSTKYSEKLAGQEPDPVTTLKHAAKLIETATFELADKAPSAVIGQLIAAAVELERATRQISETDTAET